MEDLLLPPPADPKLAYVRLEDLPAVYMQPRVISPAAKRKAETYVGRWPGVSLGNPQGAPLFHKNSKLDSETASPLGPVHLSEFKPEVRAFVEKELLPKLTADEKKKLVEGKWPEYSKELVQLSRTHDLSMPGVMLPGSPKQWDRSMGRGKASDFSSSRLALRAFRLLSIYASVYQQNLTKKAILPISSSTDSRPWKNVRGRIPFWMTMKAGTFRTSHSNINCGLDGCSV